MKKTIILSLAMFITTSAYADLTLRDLNDLNEPALAPEYTVKSYTTTKQKKEVKEKPEDGFRVLFEFGQSASFHPMADGVISKNFKNKLSSNGAWVQNPRYTASAIWTDGDSYSKVSGLITRDCLDQSAFGGTYSFGAISDGRWIYGGLMLGGYVIQTQAWRDIYVAKYWVDVNNKTGIVPLIGFELNISLLKTKHFEVNFHNFLSPLLTNHALTVGVGF